jgi:enoyl-CoA hydratase
VTNWTVEYRHELALLTYSRPPENYIGPSWLFALVDIIDKIAEEIRRVKGGVPTGGLEGFFIKHGDISGDPQWVTTGRDGKIHSAEFEAYLDASHRLDEIPQPTIAAIDGLASGGGSEIALACTMRAGSPRARLQQPELPAGIIPGGGAMVRLPRLVGPGVAAEAILTGRIFEADEVFRVGWLHVLLSAEGFVDHAVEWAGRVARNSDPALIAAKGPCGRTHYSPSMTLSGETEKSTSVTSWSVTSLSGRIQGNHVVVYPPPLMASFSGTRWRTFFHSEES